MKYGDKEEIHTKLPTYKIGKIIYIPIQLLATALEWGLDGITGINTLYINPVVYAVHYEKGEWSKLDSLPKRNKPKKYL